MEDVALFGNDKAEIADWRQAIIEFLARQRVTLHPRFCQVAPTRCGIPWLGLVIYPDHRKLKARKARHTTRRLESRHDAWCSGEISFAEFDATVQGWINPVRYADTWGLRRAVFRRVAARQAAPPSSEQ